MKDAYLLIGEATRGIKEIKSDYIPVMCYPVWDGDLFLGHYPCSQVWNSRQALEEVINIASEQEDK